MKKILILSIIFLNLFSDDFSKIRERNIYEIDKIINIYKNRLNCIKENNSPKECITKYPNSKKSDNLALLLCSSFPASYYKNILLRDIKMLENEKICWGKALNREDAINCLK